MRIIIFFSLLLSTSTVFSQGKTYEDSLNLFRQDYISTHEVIKGDAKKAMQFFPVTKKYRVTARFERTENAPWFGMKTSAKRTQSNRVYGVLHFTIRDTVLKLNIYQSEDLMKMPDYADYLFLPFMDITNGEETYDNGRYIDLRIKDIVNNSFTIDFNKAYNPYCAYVSNTYNCPIPPAENNLPVAIRAGEMKFAKAH